MHCHQAFPYGIDEPAHTTRMQTPPTSQERPTPQESQTNEASWQRLKLITDQIRDRLDDDQILQVIVRELSTMPTIMNCGVILYDSNQKRWNARYTYAAPSASEQRFTQSIHEYLEAKSLIHLQRLFLLCPLGHSTHSSNPSSYQPLEILVSSIVMDSALNTTGQAIVGILWLSKLANCETGFSSTEMHLVEQVTTQYTIALQQQHLLQAVQTQVDQVEKLNQLRDSFLNTVSHELRTPLANMKLGLAMLEIALNGDDQQLHGQPASAAYYLKLVQDACEQEIHLVNDLLLLQQLEAGIYPLLPNAILVQDWLSEIVQSFESKALEQRQHLELHFSDDLPRLVCDLILLDRVLRGLLTNACKFTPADGKITVSAQVVLGTIQISVVNSGLEIPATELEHVFDKFYRVPINDSWQHQGTGLGLALIKGLMTHLGGSIRVSSTNHQVCFVVELSQTQCVREVAEHDRLMGYVAYYLSRGKTIISPTYGALTFTGLVYNYWGYHQDFLSFWQQLQQRRDFGYLYLEKDAFSFHQFLDGNYTVSKCARCCLPIPNPAGKAYTTPSCTRCDDPLLNELIAPLGAIAIEASVQPPLTYIIVVGQLPPHVEELQQWFKLNGFEVSFVAHPDEMTLDFLPEAVELILLLEDLSESQAQSWVQTLRRYTQLRHTPIIALSAKAGCGQTWMDGFLSLEDYLITPMNGNHLAHHLQQLTERGQVTNAPCWFPIYG
ncbi:MAG: hypothetical protein KME45_04575 [Stenomitos rutilans HA7619-LM2]|jgi:signal transduction histidine kinase|nr:hypothetical protein [Stenomitos rutilans HA7619-LM2]